MATAEQLDSRCDIEIMGVALAENEPKMMEAVMRRAVHHMRTAVKIRVYCAEPRDDGWLEWIMRVIYPSGHGITIGAIRRTAGSEVEFHS